MIQLLIVEDEEIIRKGLQYTIDWLSLDIVIAGVAENGKEGLDLIRKLDPDIVLTDIKMPIMDGLTMLEKASEELYKIVPIILTSYSEFDYAKTAIRLKVFDYLLKPVNDDKLYEIFTKAKNFLEKERFIHLLEGLSNTVFEESSAIFHAKHSSFYVSKLLEKIEHCYQIDLSLANIAKELKVSESYLCRAFKSECNYTFLDFLNRYRVQKAVELLASGEYRIYEIADLCGFSSYKRFYQVFKKYTDNNPTEFIKNACCVVKNED